MARHWSMENKQTAAIATVAFVRLSHARPVMEQRVTSDQACHSQALAVSAPLGRGNEKNHQSCLRLPIEIGYGAKTRPQTADCRLQKAC